jgi:hypothetical protein
MSGSRTEFLEPLALGLFFQAAHIFSSGEPCVCAGETLCAKIPAHTASFQITRSTQISIALASQRRFFEVAIKSELST